METFGNYNFTEVGFFNWCHRMIQSADGIAKTSGYLCIAGEKCLRESERED